MARAKRLKEARGYIKEVAKKRFGVPESEIGIELGYTGAVTRTPVMSYPETMTADEARAILQERNYRVFDGIFNPELELGDKVDCEVRKLSRSQWESLKDIEGYERVPGMQPSFKFREEWIDKADPTIPFARIYALNINEMIDDPDTHGLRERLGITPTVLAVQRMGGMFRRMTVNYSEIMVETAPNFHGVVDHQAFMIAAPDHDALENFIMMADLT